MKKDSIKAVSFTLLTIFIILTLNLLFTTNYIQNFLGLAPFDATVTIADVCGNNICETGESCSSCSTDCGSCPAPPTNGGDSGGSGSSSSSSGSTDFCQVTWYCALWSNQDQQCGNRDCIDINNCDSNVAKPEEGLQCPSSGVADQQPYCGDNICNNNEDFSACQNDCPIKETNNIWFITMTSGIIIIILTLGLLIWLDKKKRKELKKIFKKIFK